MNGKSTGLLPVVPLMKRETTRKITVINGETKLSERNHKNTMQKTINAQNIYTVLANGENENCKFQSIGASIPELAVHLF